MVLTIHLTGAARPPWRPALSHGSRWMTHRSKKTKIAAAGASLALVAAMVGTGLTTASTSAWAASTAPGLEQVRQATPSPAPNPGRGGQGERPGAGNMQQREQMQQAYLNALAGRLGL